MKKKKNNIYEKNILDYFHLKNLLLKNNMTRLTQEQIEKIIELRKNTTMDNASIAVQVGCKKSVVAYIVSKARKHGVHVPKAPRANSIQTQFQKAIQKFL